MDCPELSVSARCPACKLRERRRAAGKTGYWADLAHSRLTRSDREGRLREAPDTGPPSWMTLCRTCGKVQPPAGETVCTFCARFDDGEEDA